MEEGWQDFGQTVSLTSRIRELLLNYPEGTSIFKELIQNADDAKGQTVSLCLDHRTHGTASLAFGQPFAQFQGPALLVHNNATFTDKDFESIRQIGASLKRGEAGKTGKYGLGFNSCYHITDIPIFVSGRYLCLFDPGAKFLPGAASGNPGKRIDFVAAEFASKFPDSATPLQAFGCDMKEAFDGTLFRFALRTEEMAAVSDLSKQVYGVQKMQELLYDLQREAHLILLFLKSVENLRIMEWLPGKRKPDLLFACSLKNPSPMLRMERSMFARAARAVATLAPPPHHHHQQSSTSTTTTTTTTTTDLDLQLALQHQQLVTSQFQLEILGTTSSTTTTSASTQTWRFLLAQGCSGVGTPAWTLASHVSQQLGTVLVPWCAVALPLPTTSTSATEINQLDGRLFCFLPLPASSGLPAHINGTFELSSNRRDLWHGADLLGVGKQRAAWNSILLADIAAPVYARLLAAAALQLGPIDSFFQLWPTSVESLRARDSVEALVAPWLAAIAVQPVAYTQAGKGRWLPPRDAIFLDDRAAKDVELTEALLHLGLPVVSSMPQHIVHLFVAEAVTQPQLLTPTLLRQFAKLQQIKDSSGSSTTTPVPAHLAGALFDFAVSDIFEFDSDSLRELSGVRLIPLSDGCSVVSLEQQPHSSPSSSVRLFIPRGEEAVLFKAAKSHLVNAAALRPDPLQKLIGVAAREKGLNLGLIDCTAASQFLLPSALPASFQGQCRIQWKADGDHPSREWMAELWKWLATQQQQHQQSATTTIAGGGGLLTPLSSWPIIPTTAAAVSSSCTSTSITSVLVAPEPLATTNLIAPATVQQQQGEEEEKEEETRKKAQALLVPLLQLGCAVLDTDLTHPVTVVAQFSHAADGSGVLKALQNAFKKVRPGSMERWFEKIESTQRDELRQFLLQPRWFTGQQAMKQEQMQFLKSLPIFAKAASTTTTTASTTKEKHTSSLFVNLIEQQRFLAPFDLHIDIAGCDSILRHPSLLKSCGREVNSILLDHLGVKELSKTDFYKQHVLPTISVLPPAVSIQLLRELPVLQQSDPTIVSLMKNTPLVMSGSGSMTLASHLYDPRNADLVLLLEPGKNFPAGEYAAVLDQLRVLGMRATAGRDTVLQAARDIEQQSCGSSTSNNEIDDNGLSSSSRAAAAARGRALLAYLDMEAPRLNNPPKQGEGGKGGGGGGFDLDAVFSRVFSSFMGGNGESTTSSSTIANSSSSSFSTATNKGTEHGVDDDKEVLAFWKTLSSLSWCPVQQTPPLANLPWCSSLGQTSSKQRITAKPLEMRPRTDTWLAGSQYLIIDGEVRSPVLLKAMSWATPLLPGVLARQLAAIGTAFQPPIAETALKQQLAEIVPQLYRTLANLPPDALSTVKAVLGDAPCIWIGDGFAAPSRVALRGPLNLSSAGVYVIPLELAPFRELLLALGIPASFSADQYIGVLNEMQATAKDRPLTSIELEQALGIAAALAEQSGGGGGGGTAAATINSSKATTTELFLPDERAVLRPVSQLMYNDAPWTQGAPPNDSFFVHAVISNDVADRLGVTSLQRCLLACNADAFSVALTGNAVEAFGQSEALTTRLRHILEAYPDGSGVLMELLQNADDAGATTARFLLDQSQWGADRVMGSRMAAWQGPALFAWNDALFSPADVHNIARIGQDTKLSRPGSTGRFGLGFNSVFHFTDLPSFVSGDLLVMFDPHAAYLPGVTPAQPGVKIRFPRSPLVDHFPDSFEPYKVFGCDMRNSYNGTLFRFALRSAEIAPLSQIKPQAYQPSDVLALFENFKGQAAHALLFLKSLKKVELWVRDSPSTQPRQLFSAEATTSLPGALPPQAAVKAFVTQSDGGGGGGGGSKDTFYKQLKETKEEDLPSTCTAVDITLIDSSNTNTSSSENDGSGGGGGGDSSSLIQQQHQQQQQQWLVCNLIAGGAARKLALEGSNPKNATPRGWVPWAGVAAPVNPPPFQPAATFNGRAFCFLPLPTMTHLPVHLNGLFELSSNRRDLWHGKDLSGVGKKRADWNSAVLADGVAVGYARLLVAATRLPTYLDNVAAFYDLWPQQLDLPQPWDEVSISLYRLLLTQAVLWSAARGGCWVAPAVAIYMPPSTSDSSGLEQRIAVLLRKGGVPVVDAVPAVLIQNLLTCHPHLKATNVLSPAYLRRHLAAAKGLSQLTLRNENDDDDDVLQVSTACLEYCLMDEPWLQNDKGKTGLADLVGVPLIQLADGSLGSLSLRQPSSSSSTVATALLLLPTSAQQLALFKDQLAGQLIDVVNDTTLSTQLRQVAASGVVNIRALDVDGVAAEVLPAYLHSSWKNQLCVSAAAPSEDGGGVDAEWLLQLWDVLSSCENNNNNNNNKNRGETTASSSSSLANWPLIPALHRGEAVFAAPSPFSGLVEEGAFTEAAMSALSRLGCAFVPLKIAKRLPEWVRSSCIHSATGPGVLEALNHARGGAAIEVLHDEEVDALRSFLLQSRWFDESSSRSSGGGDGGGGDGDSTVQQLRLMPIYRCCTRGITVTTSASKFTSLQGKECFLVPTEFTELAALPSEFIHSTSAGESQVLVKVLGVKEISLHDVLISHALPNVAVLDAAPLASLLLLMLHQIVAKQAFPLLVECLRSVPCILTEAGTRVVPSQSFDPRSASLKGLLGQGASFPVSPVCDDDAALDALVELGMRTSITPDALLEVARQIHAEITCENDGGGDDGDEADNSADNSAVLRRATALLTALDELASSSQQEQQQQQPEEEQIEEESDFWQNLSNLSFLPVLTSPPFSALPWPQTGTHTTTTIAPPRLVRPQSSAWLVSASLHLLKIPCSDALAQKLNWTAAKIPPKVLAAQLIALGHLHTEESLKNADETVIFQITAAVDTLYAKLDGRDVKGDEAEMVSALLTSGAAAVWISSEFGFVSPTVVAVDTPVDLRPYIFSLSEEYSGRARLLKLMKISSLPTTEQYLSALSAMFHGVGKEGPLDAASLSTALALVDGLGGTTSTSAAGEEPTSTFLNNSSSITTQTAYLPDSFGVLAPAPSLMVNDAPWLATQEDLHMVHADIAPATAIALGAKSLRYHHQVENQTSERLPCPPATLLRQLLTVQSDPALLALSDILEVADVCGCKGVEIHLDGRTHPSQSVLQPGLSALQGPALCVHLKGVVLSADELCRLQSPPTPFRLRQGACRFGCGLLGSYTLTDVIQVISGDSFYIFDPSGAHLAMEAVKNSIPDGGGGGGTSTNTSNNGHAKQYRHAGTDLPRQFADQFTVWDWATGVEDVGVRVQSTLLRLPLRSADQAQSVHAMVKAPWTPAAALDMLTAFASTISQALLFSTHLTSISISHQGVNNSDATTTTPTVIIKRAQIDLPVPSTTTPSSTSQANSHRVWCEEREWKKTVKPTSNVFLGLSALGKQFSWIGGGGAKDGSSSSSSASAAEKEKQKQKEKAKTEEASTAARLTQHTISISSSAAADGGGGGGEGVVSVYQEHWMVSVCAGGYGSGVLASDKKHTLHSFNPQAAVCVCIDAQNPRRLEIVPSPGVLAPLPLSFAALPQSPSMQHSAAAISLHTLPFTVCGFFALTRSKGRKLLTPTAAAAPATIVDGGEETTAAGAAPGSPRETTDHVRARFNAALLRCAGQAAVILLEKVVQQNHLSECIGLFSLLPTTALPPSTGPDVAALCSQMCSLSAKKRMWKLRRGDLATLREGCFMERSTGTGAGNHRELSNVARDFMQARLPLFDVPDGTKSWLEAWGVQNLRGVTPATVRQELKSQAASGALERGGGFSLAAASELLLFATDDVLPRNNDNTEDEEDENDGSLGIVNLDALSECKGLPCLDAQSQIQIFGRHPMLLLSSPDASLDPTASLFVDESTVLCDMLHVQLAETMAPLLKHPSIAAALCVEQYSLEHFAKHVARVLPAHWAPMGMAGDGAMAVAWQDGRKGGPAVEYLQQIWSFLHAWRASTSSSTSAATTATTWIEPLTGMALLPLCSGDVVRLTFRHAVVIPPLAPASSLMDADAPVEYAEPWRSKLVPALLEARVFVLDPRFASQCASICNASYTAAAIENANNGGTTSNSQEIDEGTLLVSKLRTLSDLGQLQWSGLSSTGRSSLVDWLADQAAEQTTPFREADLELLRGAPIWPNLGGGAAAAGANVQGAVATVVVISVLGSCEAVPRSLQHQLLLQTESLSPLYRLLNVNLLDPAAFVAAVFNSQANGGGGFRSLPAAAQTTVLSFILRDWQSLHMKDEFIDALAGSEFVTTSASGGMASPKMLYDPTVPLLATIFAGKPVFPFGKFAMPEWIAILQVVGLRRCLDRKTFLEAAHSVEQEGVRVSSTTTAINSSLSRGIVLAAPGQKAPPVWDAAAALARHLSSGEGADLLLGVEGRQMAEELREISFLPAKSYAVGSAAGAPTLSKYISIVLPADAALAWTQVPILDAAAAPPPPQSAHANLRISSPPPFKIVALHLTQLGGSSGSSSSCSGSNAGNQSALGAWPFPDLTPQAAFQRTLKYLDSEGLSEGQLQQLRGLPIIPVQNGTRFVQPSSIFVRLSVEAAPLLHELPPEFVSGLAVLKQLGVKDSASAADLLNSVKSLPHGARLSTPLIQAVSRVLHHLLLENSAPEALAAANRNEIPVVNAQGVVMWPATCIYGDATAWISLVPRLAAAGVPVLHPTLSSSPTLCTALKIPSTGEVVQEHLDTNDVDVLETLSTIQGVAPAHVAARLRDPCVAMAVRASLEAQHRWAPHRGQTLPSLDDVTSILQRAADGLCFVRRCRTTLATVTRYGSVTPLTGSGAEVSSYVSPGGEQFVVAAAPGVELSAAVAAGISKLFKAQSTLPVAPLFDAATERVMATANLLSRGDEFARTTTAAAANDNDNGHNSTTTAASSSGGENTMLLVTSAGELGAVLTPQDAAAVKLQPLRRYAARELVAVRMPTGRLQYARVSADSSPPPGAAAFRVTLEISVGKFHDVLSTEILNFSGGGGEIVVMDENTQQQQQQQQSLPLLPIEASSSSSSTNNNSTTAAVSQNTQQASATEVISAVRSMLEVAGIPLENDAAALMEQNLVLEQRLKAAQQNLLIATAEKESAEVSAEDIKSAWQCRICLTREVDVAMSACGHMLCSGCASQLPRPQCPFCRKGSTLTRLYR